MGLIGLVITIVGLSAAYGLTIWLHGRSASADRGTGRAVISRTLVGHELEIPGDWLRDAGDQPAGFSSRVDLRLALPLGPQGTARLIEVTLLPLSQVRTSASLLDGVYLHQFMPTELAGPAGLVGKPLYATEGFADETVWYDALSQNPFVAKCSSPPEGGSAPGQCLRTVALPGGLAAVYVFDSDVLGAWKSFDPKLSAALHEIGAL